ncbi:MAG: bis-aminopropyl spermidine synthase family protein [Candidatus Staskawiczbacteria bacterium]|nr:bis-aminopropyl spermidine synthase family protein [Candidatus Staskawiczbacteria bacterium]
MERNILSYLLGGQINFWELASQVAPIDEFVKSLEKMERSGLVGVKKANLFLTAKGLKLSKKLNISSKKILDRNSCRVQADSALLKKFKKLRLEGVFNEDYDQLQLLPESVIKKVEILKIRGDIDGKRIICLGDDDMVAIALALTGLPKEIAVLEVDDKIIKHENKIFRQIKAKAKAHNCNLLEGVPEKFKNKYDVFITEPPDTVFGNSLFFSRGIECLKKDGGIGYIGISETDFSRRNYMAVEKNILKMGALVTDIYNKLEPYEVGTEKQWVFGIPEKYGWPKKPWFFSDLFRTEIVEGAKPMFKKSLAKKILKKLISTNIYVRQ